VEFLQCAHPHARNTIIHTHILADHSRALQWHIPHSIIIIGSSITTTTGSIVAVVLAIAHGPLVAFHMRVDHWQAIDAIPMMAIAAPMAVGERKIFHQGGCFFLLPLHAYIVVLIRLEMAARRNKLRSDQNEATSSQSAKHTPSFSFSSRGYG
jgi:hypothetical protein